MKNFKNLFLVVLMVLVVSPIFAEEENSATVSLTGGSRYVSFAMDFLPPNKDFFKIGFDIPVKSFSFGPSIVSADGYGELSCFAGKTIEIAKKIDLTLSVIPIAWQYEGKNLSMAIIGNGSIALDIPSHPNFLICYAHVPGDLRKNGWYFSVGISENLFGFDLAANVAYNKELFLDGLEGFNKMLEVSKSVDLFEKLALKGLLRYWMNDPKINESETVWLLSLIYDF